MMMDKEYCDLPDSESEEYIPKSSVLNDAYDENVRPIIDLIDKLRMIGLENDISLPTVVVIGDQSSGKSSVLEAISGVQLPRGSGIVTRCPLELKMKNYSIWSAELQYTNIHGERVNIEINKPNEIEGLIRNAQTAMTRTPKDISDDLISLDVVGPGVPNLSIIDLPGIARIAVDGQTKDTLRKIKSIIYKYAKKENTVMLCVIPCNQDVATNESLDIAREVDPDGLRSLGVLTKPDLVDHGTEKDIIKLVNNKLYKLQKGFSVIKCRSQKEIDEGVSVNEARAIEKDFFENHEYFNQVYTDGMAGVEHLANKLTIELVNHIKSNIPAVREQLQSALKETQSRYELLGRDPPKTESEKHIFLIEIGSCISRCFEDLSKGIYACNIPQEHRVYAAIYQLFEELNDRFMANEPNECDEELLNMIRTELNSQRGVELPPFLSYNVCRHFISLHIDKVKDAIFTTLHEAANTILETTSFVIDDKTQGYSKLRNAFHNEMLRIHSTMMNNCQNSIRILLSQEEFPFTMDRAYYNSAKMEPHDIHAALKNLDKRIFCEVHKDKTNHERSNDDIIALTLNYQKTPQLEENEKNSDEGENDVKVCKPHECIKCIKEKEKRISTREHIMAENLNNYMKVAFTRLMDNIAMTIIYHLLQQFNKELYLCFANFATNSSNLDLISEEKSREKERYQLKSKLDRLEKGIKEITNFCL